MSKLRTSTATQTLGLFDSSANRDDDDDSESGSNEDDDEMYDDGYDDEDEMDFEEGPMPDHDDVVSDEDEDIEGMGEVEGVPGDVEYEMDLVMERDDDEVETLSEDSSGEDDGGDDDDDEGEADEQFGDAMDEITGDDENASMADHEEDQEWDDDDGALFHAAIGEDGGSPHGGPLDHIREVIDADERSGPDGIVRIGMGGGDDEYFEDEITPDDDDGKSNPMLSTKNIVTNLSQMTMRRLILRTMWFMSRSLKVC